MPLAKMIVHLEIITSDHNLDLWKAPYLFLDRAPRSPIFRNSGASTKFICDTIQRFIQYVRQFWTNARRIASGLRSVM
jgi:hypothetical protein